MPAIEIRPVVPNDLPAMIQMDHGVETIHTWQMNNVFDEGRVQINFQRIRLPRSIRLEYPRNPDLITETRKKAALCLVARIQSKDCGYLTLEKTENFSGRVVDLVVDAPFRRQGIATTMMVAAQDWLKSIGIFRMILEIPIKNEAAIALVEKLGFVYCGFLEGDFSSREIAFFYTLTLH